MNEQERVKQLVDIACEEHGNISRSAATSMLTEWGDTRAREAVEAVIEREFPATFGLESYEMCAESFRRDTGMMAPGKSASMTHGYSQEAREAEWGKWMKARRNIRSRMLESLLPTPSPTPATKQEEGK